MKWTIIVIIIVLLLIIGISISIFIRDKNQPHINPTPGGGGTLDCTPKQDPNLLIECDPKKTDDCNNCIVSSISNSCYEVTDDDPYYYRYSNNDKSRLKVPNSKPGKGWCLPTKTTTLPCNQFSGYPILVKINDKLNAWSCQCKYPNLFQNAGEFGNCLDEIACGKQQGNGELVCPKGYNFCKQGDKWIQSEDKKCLTNNDCSKDFNCVSGNCIKGSDYDPKIAICDCKQGLKYVDQSNGDIIIKSCVKDSCSPNGIQNDTGCDCTINNDPGKPYKQLNENTYQSWISCPDVYNSSSCNDVNPRCVEDPCNPAGYYDKNTHSCKCLVPGTYNRVDPSNPLGVSCYNPCENNPCGNRGKCSITQLANDPNTYVAKCGDLSSDCNEPCGCNYPYSQNKPQYTSDTTKETCEQNGNLEPGQCTIFTTDNKCLIGKQVGENCIDDSNMCLNQRKDIGSRCDGDWDCLSGCCIKEYGIFGGHHVCAYC